MTNQYFPPRFKESAFTCPHCGVLSVQQWISISSSIYSQEFGSIYESECDNPRCKKHCLWINQIMIIPDKEGIALPNNDLLPDIKRDYMEARSIVNKSPRGAASLLRLCIQKLCEQLGEVGKDINTNISNLVKKGLRSSIQQALDIVRVTGNEAVHPGELDMRDNKQIALKLFDLVNLIAEVMITEPKRVEELYNSVVPERKRDAITNRDKVKV